MLDLDPRGVLPDRAEQDLHLGRFVRVRRRCHEYTSRPGGSQTTTLPQSNSSPSASARRCGPRRGPPSRSSGRLDQCACGRPATIDRGRGCRCRTRAPGARRPRTRGEAGRSSTAPSRWRGVLGDDPVARRSLAPDRGEVFPNRLGAHVVERIQPPRPQGALADQSRPQKPEVTRYGRSTDRHRRRQLADRPLTVGEQAKDRPSVLVAEGGERVRPPCSVTSWLR